MEKTLYIVSLDEEFEKSRVKAHVRTRKGKLERVKEFERKGKVRPGSKLHTVLNLLDKKGDVKKYDIMVATHSKEEIEDWKHGYGSNPYQFGDGMLGLKNKGWAERVPEKHGFWRITKEGRKALSGEDGKISRHEPPPGVGAESPRSRGLR